VLAKAYPEEKVGVFAQDASGGLQVGHLQSNIVTCNNVRWFVVCFQLMAAQRLLSCIVQMKSVSGRNQQIKSRRLNDTMLHNIT
jgi:hypothetical protein